MSPDSPRQTGVWRQTRALLYKNCLVKWRTKKASIQEVLIPLTFLGLLIIISMIQPNKRHDEVPDCNLDSTSCPSISEFIIGYTPVNNMTRTIMHKMTSEYCPEAKDAREFHSEAEMEEASLQDPENFVGVIFNDSMSYYLRFPTVAAPKSIIHTESIASCLTSSKMCEAETYWHYGFAGIQIHIDAAIIEVPELPTVDEWRVKVVEAMEAAELMGRIRDLDEEIVKKDWTLFEQYLKKHT